MTNLQLQVKHTRSLLQFLSVIRFHFTLGRAGFSSKSVNFFSIPIFFLYSWTPKQQLQDAEMFLCHKIKIEGARIFFRFNNISQRNLHNSHHFGPILALSPRIRYQNQILLHIRNRLDALYHLQHCLPYKI